MSYEIRLFVKLFYIVLLKKEFCGIILIFNFFNCRQVFITNIIPGDFDSDGHLDALISYYNKTFSAYHEKTFVKIFLGTHSQFGMC